MPTVYRRFTEKESKQWRQIYKVREKEEESDNEKYIINTLWIFQALVLLEYLIKNGSERVVDDARSHVSMIKVMRNFYYIDDKGKDEGLNGKKKSALLWFFLCTIFFYFLIHSLYKISS